MEAVIAIALIAIAFLPVYYLIVMWHGVGAYALCAILIVLYGMHIRKVYRNAKSNSGSR